MIKTTKTVISLFLSVVLVLSCLSFVSFAETLTLSGVLDGSTVGFAGSLSGAGTSTTITSVPGFGVKQSSDLVYEFSSNGLAPSKYPQIAANEKFSDNSLAYDNTLANNPGFNGFIEMQFCLPNGSDGIVLRNQCMYYQANNNTYKGNTNCDMKITPEGIYTGARQLSTSTPVEGTAFEYDRWYTLGLSLPGYDADGGIFYSKVAIYIDGKLAATQDFRYNSDWSWLFGYIGRTQLLPVDTTDEGAYIYMDNVRYGKGYYDNTLDAADEITAKGSSCIASITGNTITLNGSATVSDLKNAINKKEDTNIRVLNASGEVLGDSSSVTPDSKVVVAACNNTGMERNYAVYSIGEYEYEFENLIDGSEMFKGTVPSGTVAIVDGAYGKQASDKVYQLTSIAGSTSSQRDSTCILPFKSVEQEGTRKVLEISFMLPKGSEGIMIHLHLWGPNSQNQTSALAIKPEGFGIQWSDSFTVVTRKFDYDKWYNLALVIPGAYGTEETSNKASVYVNGVLERENFAMFTPVVKGIREVRLTSVLNNKNGDQNVVYGYVDNIRLVDCDAYVPDYDKEAVITSDFAIDTNDNTFILSEEATLADAKAKIDAPSKSVISAIAPDGSYLSDTDTLTDSDIIVVSAKNKTTIERAFSYYKVLNADGKLVIFDVSAEEGEDEINYSLQIANGKGQSEDVQIVTAIYNSDYSLKAVDVNAVAAVEGISPVSDTVSAALQEGDKVKIMFLSDITSDITPLAKSVKVK